MFRNTGANAFAKNQTRLAYEDKRDLYCICSEFTASCVYITKEVAMIIARWINCGVCLFLMYCKTKHRPIVFKLLFSIMFIQALQNPQGIP